MESQVGGLVGGDDFRFVTGAAMLKRLGSEQLRDEITAVMELVKNAYDADATSVTIELREERSPVLQRRRLGQKGVGRFAAEKLGQQLILRTRSSGQAEVLQLRFNWEGLSGDRELADYHFPIKHKKPEPFEPLQGTRLEIRGLRVRWTRTKAEKLRAQLSNLIDPESTSTDFKIQFVTPWRDLNGVLQNPLPGNETHRLQFALSETGVETICQFS